MRKQRKRPAANALNPRVRTLRIGAYDYSVEWLGAAPRDMIQLAGQHDDSEHTIKLFESNPGDMANTLLHEVLHGVFAVTGLNKHPPFNESGTEERCVCSITEGLLQVIRDNPALLLALVGLLRAGERA